MDPTSTQIDILSNVAASLLSIERLVTATAYLIGLSFAVKALYSLKVYGEARSMMSQSSSIKEPVIYLLVSALLIYIPTGFQIMLNTTFGVGSSVLAYAPVSSQSPLISGLFGPGSQVGESLTIIIQVIGVIAFVRGWVLIARGATHGQPPGATGQGLMHVFGGVLAINIIGTLEVFNNTLYGVSVG